MFQGDPRRPVHSPATASRVFSGEAVVISPSENMVRMFNTVGSRIWELADGHHTIDGIVDELLEEYETDREAASIAVVGFVDTLVDKGLLQFTE